MTSTHQHERAFLHLLGIAGMVAAGLGCAAEHTAVATAEAAPTRTPPAVPDELGAGAIAVGTTITDRPVQADRCFESGCEQAALPHQPDLPFLEDRGDGWLR